MLPYNLIMPRVLYTAFDIVPSPKGASTHILHNIRGLVNSQFDVHLLTPNDGLLPTDDTIEGTRVTRISQDLSQNFLARAIHFGKAVLTHLTLNPNYNVVHYRNIWDGLFVAQNKKRFGYKTLFEVNGFPSIELKYHYPGIDSALLIKIKEQEVATLHLSDAIICPSNVTRDYIASLGLSPSNSLRTGRKLVTVIPNGVSPSDFPASPLPRRAGRVPILLYIGTLADWQGLEVLLKALPKILEQQAVQLRIVGHGRSRQRKLLSKQIRKLGVEGRVIEYMASSRPLIASNMPIVRELVREDVDALLFSPNDPEDLARQVLVLLNDFELSKRFSDSATERALTKFTWHEAQKKLLKVYQKLLEA